LYENLQKLVYFNLFFWFQGGQELRVVRAQAAFVLFSFFRHLTDILDHFQVLLNAIQGIDLLFFL